MTPATIKFKTIQFINGLGYMNVSQIENVQHIMCRNLNIDKSKENFNLIKEAITTYFNTQNNISIQ
jgi:hypothetical protein